MNSGSADITLNLFKVDPKFKEGHPAFGSGSTTSRTIPGRRPDPKDVNITIGGEMDIEESFLDEVMKVSVVRMLFSDEHSNPKLRVKGGWKPKNTVITSDQKTSGVRV